MDFNKDVNEYLYSVLINNGIKINLNDKKLGICYFDFRERMMSFDLRFKVLKSKKINEILNSNILSNDEISSFNDIVERLENGKSIEMYLSNLIYDINIKKSDFLLKNWGIYHLHLEKKDPITKNFKKQSNLLLFLKISNDYSKILLISIDKHPKSETWYQEKWLKIIDDNWDGELLYYPGAYKVVNEVPENKMFDATKKQICAVVINNKVVFPYGCATSGDSIRNVQRADDMHNFLKLCEEDVKKNFYSYCYETAKFCRKNSRKFVNQFDFHIIIEPYNGYSWFVLYEKNNMIKERICKTIKIVGFNL